MQGMQQWHSQDFAGAGEIPCEARMHTLFGAWSLALGQIFTDARRLIRRLTVSGPAQLSYCSVRIPLLHLFSSALGDSTMFLNFWVASMKNRYKFSELFF